MTWQLEDAGIGSYIGVILPPIKDRHNTNMVIAQVFNKPDAQLIVAAPDLLEALRQLVLPLREWLEDNEGDRVIRPEITTTALRIGLAAYDKATGG